MGVLFLQEYTEKGGAGFKQEISVANWGPVIGAGCSNVKAQALQDILDAITERNFPIKKIRRREDDLPWINDTAKAMVKKKDAIYKSEGKSERREKQREKTEAYLEKMRIDFV